MPIIIVIFFLFSFVTFLYEIWKLVLKIIASPTRYKMIFFDKDKLIVPTDTKYSIGHQAVSYTDIVSLTNYTRDKTFLLECKNNSWIVIPQYNSVNGFKEKFLKRNIAPYREEKKVKYKEYLSAKELKEKSTEYLRKRESCLQNIKQYDFQSAVFYILYCNKYDLFTGMKGYEYTKIEPEEVSGTYDRKVYEMTKKKAEDLLEYVDILGQLGYNKDPVSYNKVFEDLKRNYAEFHEDCISSITTKGMMIYR